MEATAENRLPIAMRLPKREVQIVDSYAKENGITKTDAFLHFLRKGMEAESAPISNDRLNSIELLLQEILQKVDQPASELGIDAITQCVAAEACHFPAIQKAILFGSFARGEAGPESDVDLRLKIDRAEQFSLYDLARLQKALAKRLGREVDIVTADKLSNSNLAAAIEREGITVYERKRYCTENGIEPHSTWN